MFINNRGKLFMKTERLSLKFGGENDIDLETLSISLNSTVNVLKCICDNTLNENDFCKFKVESVEHGSFIINIDQILDIAPALLPYAPDILTSFKSILEIRKMLKGQTPKEIVKNGECVTITNTDGNVYHANEMIFNIYTSNEMIERELAKTSKVVMNDKTRNSLSYEFEDDEGISKVEMSKEELIPLSVPQDVEKFNNCIEENTVTTYLKVRKPDLIGDSKWQFGYSERFIYADILDKEFVEKVRKGLITFNAGKIIKVDLLVRYKGTKVLSYKILKVYDDCDYK